MATTEKGSSLPKFGEWDVNNPASAEGFTVIFAKARDSRQNNTEVPTNAHQNQPKQDTTQTKPKRWRCCC